MDRREFLAAGATLAIGGCVTAPVSPRPPAFNIDDFETVTDLTVTEDGATFVAGTTSGGRPGFVELDRQGMVEALFVSEHLVDDPYIVVDPTTVFVSQSTGPLLAVDRNTHSIRWRKSDVRPSGFPTADGGAYVLTDTDIVAASVEDGRPHWSHELPPDQSLFPTAVVGNTLVCTWGGGRITGLSITDGTERWTHRLGGDLPPTFHRDGTVYAGTGTNANDPRAVAIDAASGEIRWSRRFDDAVVSPDPGAQNVYLSHGISEWGVVAVDSGTGVERWRRSGVSVGFASPWGPIGSVEPTAIVALDPASGKERWRLETSSWGQAGARIELAGRQVIAVDPDGITAVAIRSGRRRWRHRTPLERHPSIESGGSTVAVESAGTVLGFRLDG